MGLRVICAGLSRTGTFSLKRALEQLGIGRCYHMHEFFSHPEHAAIWEDAASGAAVDWEHLLQGYAAACDTPACLFWRELSAFYPDAKVILTLRDPFEWYESMRSTVVEVMQRPSLVPDPNMQEVLRTAARLMLDGFFGGKFDERPEALARLEAHHAAVQAVIAPSRLLVYDVSQGWEPLCEFLGLSVPSGAFPKTNERTPFRERIGLSPLRRVSKAFAYITHRDRLLVFRQPAFPEAGVQVPAGTIRADEPPERAALREAIEETGWRDFGDPVFLGRAEFDCTPFGRREIHDRWFFHLEIRGEPPETWIHGEADPESGEGAAPIAFSFFWRPIQSVDQLIADHGSMLPELRRSVPARPVP